MKQRAVIPRSDRRQIVICRERDEQIDETKPVECSKQEWVDRLLEAGLKYLAAAKPAKPAA